MNRFLNNIRKCCRSESCVCTCLNFFIKMLFWNILPINLWSLSRSQNLCISRISLLMSLISRSTRMMRLNNWISINYSKIVYNWRSVSFFIASILWYFSSFMMKKTSILIYFSVFAIWSWNFLMMNLFWISLFSMQIILLLSYNCQIFRKILLLLMFLLLILIIGLRFRLLHFM